MMQKPDARFQESDDHEIDLNKLLVTLWAGKILIGASSVATLLASTAYLALTPPTYEANAMLKIDNSRGSMLALPSSMSAVLGGESASTLAEIEIIRSRQVLGRAVASLNLDWQAAPVKAPVIGSAVANGAFPLPELRAFSAYARAGDAIEVSYLDVPSDWIGRALLVEKVSESEFAVTLPNGTVLNGFVNNLLSDEQLRVALLITRLQGEKGRQYVVAHLSEFEAIELLSANLNVSERGRQTGIIEARLRGTDPRETAVRLNALIRAYQEQNVTQSAAEAQKSLDFVESQIPAAKAAVEAAETALNEYRTQQNSVDLEFETESLLTEATSIEAQLRELSLKEEQLKEKYTRNHPVYRQLLEQRSSLGQRLNELQSGIGSLPETQREVVNLTRDLDVAQAAYVELMNRAQELRVLSASQIGSVRIIDEAATQPDPVAPKKAQISVFAAAVGALMGILAVLARNWIRRGIESAVEIERLGIPVFATINKYEGRAKDAFGRLTLIARDDTTDISVEAIRSLRTSLYFHMLNAKSKSVVITSAAPGAGKSFTSANLAAVAAQAGQKVVLIDADMRRGVIRKYFGLPKQLPGLTEYLEEKVDLDRILQPCGIENLSVVTAGHFPSNPSELLMRGRLVELIDFLGSRYDLIIFDAPPVLAVTDAAIIGRSAGSVIAVARHLVTPKGELIAVQQTLQNAGVTLNGGIFNAFDPKRAKMSGDDRYGYAYSYTNRYIYTQNGKDD